MAGNDNIRKLEEWLAQPTLDAPVRAELTALYDKYMENPNDAEVQAAINDRYYTEMVFGTAGMRGVMGAGPNRISIHTIRKISQGYAEHIVASAVAAGRSGPSVVIAHDNRKDSGLYAFESACVFAANGVKAYLYDVLSATPLLSFSVRRLGTDGGVVVTASHNNKDYNGYKIYDHFGCQCMPDEAEEVAARIAGVDIWTGPKTNAEKYGKRADSAADRIRIAADTDPLIEIVPGEIIDEYIAAVIAESKQRGACRGLQAVYTPLNGAGNKLVRRILEEAGIGGLHVVKEQEDPDPNFTTCPIPNPEKPEALGLALGLARDLAADGDAPDIVFGTDPDADRLGAMVRHDGDYTRLSGNQVGVLIFDYIIRMREDAGTMPDSPVFITTIVSTPLTSAMAAKHSIETRKVLTGFKNIGDQMNRLEAAGEEDRYIFGFEESCGYLSGRYARDKDSQNAALLICEAAGLLKREGKTLVDRLEEVYSEYGYFIDGLEELVRPGEAGMHEIAAIMSRLREDDMLGAFSVGVSTRVDYLSGERADYGEGAPVLSKVTGIPSSDVIEFELKDGCSVLARPSGTEPKLKFYYTGVGSSEAEAEARIADMKAEMGSVIK